MQEEVLMESMLVRLKEHDPRRGHVLRRYTYNGIKFQVERGWYRVSKAVAEYLRGVRQEAGDLHSPLAFDVCTEAEAKELDAREDSASRVRKGAADAVEVSVSRDEKGAVTTAGLPEVAQDNGAGKKGRKG
jgi:hypothetical protein